MADVLAVKDNRLPMAQVPMLPQFQAAAPSAPALREPDLVARASRRPLVLIVDDYEDARELYREYFEFVGLRTITAASGQEAIRLAVEYEPSVIVMDTRMPGMAGTKAMLALRRQTRLRTTPIIALTTHVLEKERLAILAEGFDCVLTKPCLPDQLLLSIDSALKGSVARYIA